MPYWLRSYHQRQIQPGGDWDEDGDTEDDTANDLMSRQTVLKAMLNDADGVGEVDGLCAARDEGANEDMLDELANDPAKFDEVHSDLDGGIMKDVRVLDEHGAVFPGGTRVISPRLGKRDEVFSPQDNYGMSQMIWMHDLPVFLGICPFTIDRQCLHCAVSPDVQRSGFQVTREDTVSPSGLLVWPVLERALGHLQ